MPTRRPPRARAGAPPIDDHGGDNGAGSGELLIESIAAGPVVLDRDPLSAHALGQQDPADLGGRLGLGHPVDAEADLLERPMRLRSARDDPRRPQQRRRSPASPAVSAVSSHPRNPMPVVTTTVSGAAASNPRVASSSAGSSRCGTIDNAGACRTMAPRRVSAASMSPDRRSAVTRTTYPARVCSSAGAGIRTAVPRRRAAPRRRPQNSRRPAAADRRAAPGRRAGSGRQAGPSRRATPGRRRHR